MIEQFHFLRPEWFVAIVLLLILMSLLLRRRLSDDNWKTAIDKKLLPHLLVEKPIKTSRRPLAILFLASLMAIIALAGPTWEKLPQPVFKKQSALIIALDLSRSMNAVDLKPSRLARARYKIADILQRRKEGQTGLIVYAANAYVVTPLSDDTETINALVPSLNTSIMPVEGKNTTLALSKARELLHNAGFSEGDILLVTDNIEKVATIRISEVTKLGYRVSILVTGTKAGAPIPLEGGGFLKDKSGQVILSKVAIKPLRDMITEHGGIFSRLSNDDTDLEQLQPLIEIKTLQGESIATEIQADIWRELGPWLLVLLLPLAALAFRRGYLMLACIVLLPLPQPAHAFSLSDLWLSNNERAMMLYQDKKYDDAAELFDDKKWKASAYYRARQYELSIRLLQIFDTAEDYYNRGNALTRQNEIAEAIKAYTKALEIEPKHEDAKYNKELLEKLPQQQQDQGQKESGNPEQQEEDESKESEASDSGNADEMNPEPEEQNQEEQQPEEMQASENPSANEDKKEAEPGESKDQSDSSTDSTADNKEREAGQQSQNQGSEKQQEKEPQPQDQESDKKQKDEQALQEQQPDEQNQSEETQPEQGAQQKKDTAEQAPLSDQAVEQWLNKVEDDPGGLLRRKFKYLYQKQEQHKDETQ